MNKDRAIQMLERMQDPGPYEPQITSEAFDALQMAIEALKYSEIPNSSDTISRQDAKDMIKNHKSDFSTEKDYRTARACVNAVPPEQPEIIRCKDCKYGILDCDFSHERYCDFKGNEWNNDNHFCGHAKRREVTT